jgi:LysM repeat protein
MKKTSITARILASVALLGSIAVVLVVVSSETGGEDTARNPAASKPKNTDSGQGEGAGQQNRGGGPKVYEVQEGDSLTAIAVETGVPIETIEELNPGLDPQALIPGQKLKLR